MRKAAFPVLGKMTLLVNKIFNMLKPTMWARSLDIPPIQRNKFIFSKVIAVLSGPSEPRIISGCLSGILNELATYREYPCLLLQTPRGGGRRDRETD